MKRVALLITVVSLMLGQADYACARPVVGTSANTIPQGVFMIDLWSAWLDMTKAYDDTGEEWNDLPDGADLRSVSVVPRIYYGVADWFTMRVALPLEYRTQGSLSAAGETDKASGLGDILLEPKVKVYESDTGKAKVSLIGGVRFPSGDQESSPHISDGSTDVLVGVVVTHGAGAVSLHGVLGYWFNGENKDGENLDDRWIGRATVEVPLGEGWSVLGEVHATTGEDPSVYRRINLCPGVSWTSGERLTVGMAVRVSAWAKGGDDYSWAPHLRASYTFF